ncbi:MAG TPA: metal ABC transporter substrate-binding protein [Solirubrobacteraceae bacterium]|nr:metal ABC transporter substrate-binding protein [Solirubrobacteraceae bacterium]
MSPPLRRLIVVLALPLAAVVAVGALAQRDTGGTDALAVVATTPQVADLVRQVGGERVHVVSLLPAGTDPHDHELRPSDVGALERARLVVRSGGEADEWAQPAIDAAGSGTPVLTLLDRVRRRGEDPHWWQDPSNAVLAVAAIRDALARADRAGRDAYRAGAGRATQRLRRLDAAIARCWQAVPRDQRRLVTTHDSYGYYAGRYGLRVLGSVVPSLSSRGQPSAGEVDALVRAIRRHRVRAIFTERALNARVERAIAEQAGATVGRPLWADALGPPGSSGATYMQALAADTRGLVDGLAGRRVGCDLPA